MNYTVLSQRDPAWRYKTLGFTRTTIGMYGCTLTALTCWLNIIFGTKMTPDYVNTKLKEVKGFSDGTTIGRGNLIVWSRIPLAFPDINTKMKFVKRVRAYNNVEVAFWIYIKRIPVLVEVNANSIGAPRHWLLYVGNQKAVDPWTGTIVHTNRYPAIGYTILDRA